MSKRQTLKTELRVYIWERDNRSCHYCGITLPRPGKKGSFRTQTDHIIPHSQGGSDDPTNLVICCKTCNRSKADKDYAYYLNQEYTRVTIHLSILKKRLKELHKRELRTISTARQTNRKTSKTIRRVR